MQAASKIHIALGFVTVGLGTTPFLAALGILPTRQPANGDAPEWVAFAIGLAFVLAGIMVIVRGFADADDSSSELPETASRGLRVFYQLLVTPIPILLALILSWVAFGPGERHFSMSIGGGGVAAATPVSGSGGDIMGRIAFGFGAVLAWIVVAYMLSTLARRWFSQRDA